MSVRFTQSCPTCGRRIRVRASLLGCTVACQHCHSEFVAHSGFFGGSESHEDVGAAESEDALMRRVEAALEKAQQAAIS